MSIKTIESDFYGTEEIPLTVLMVMLRKPGNNANAPHARLVF